MAFLNVTEYAEIAVGPAGRVGQMPLGPKLASYGVGNAGATTQGAVFNAKTRFVRLHTDTICCYEIDTNPTAVAIGAGMSSRLAAGQTEYVAVPLGGGFRVAAILST
jgi:hypothetical protein